MNEKSEYELIFDQRSKDYDLAMQRFPSARDQEFLRLFDHVDLNHIKTLADLPSGGGYLNKFVPTSCKVEAYEPCSEFNANQAHATDVGLDNIILPANHYDAVVCLAAIHHVKNKAYFVTNIYNALKPGGYLLLGDVFADNPINQFLDNFAGKHNGTGHSGMYLGASTIRDILAPLGASIINIEEKACPWLFNTNQDMLDFCRLLFGLQDISDDVLLDALQNHLDISKTDNGVSLGWKLIYHTAQKPAH